MPDPVDTQQPDDAAQTAVETATTDAPAAEPTEADRMEAVFEKATAPDEPATPDEPVEGEEPEPAAEPEPEPAAEPEPATEPEEPVELTEEQQDEAEMKSLGFKNQKAQAEFKRMRKFERETEPLLKDYEERAKPMAQRWEHLMDYCEKSNIPPDMFGNGMAMIAGIASNDLDVMRKTRDGLKYELDKLNQRLGDTEDAPTRHPDIQAALDNGDISPELARKMAAERAELAHHNTLRQTETQRAQQQQEHAAAVQRATQEIDAIQAEYEPIDPHFRAKAEALIPILKPIFAKLPPAEWASAFREAYRNAPTPAAAPAARPAPLRNQPLRSTAAPVGSVTATPRTPEEIMDAAIARANQSAGVA